MEENQFTEKQYLGLNKMSFFKRMVLSIFCFLAYYWSENHDKSGDLFFFLGISIFVISALLVFVLHFETRITKDAIILDGLWTSRKVKIDVNSLQSAEIVKYSRFFLNRSVYNLHFKGSIRFFTRGKDAVKLTDKDGQVYLIGSQKVEELERIIKNKLNNK